MKNEELLFLEFGQGRQSQSWHAINGGTRL